MLQPAQLVMAALVLQQVFQVHQLLMQAAAVAVNLVAVLLALEALEAAEQVLSRKEHQVTEQQILAEAEAQLEQKLHHQQFKQATADQESLLPATQAQCRKPTAEQ
jgi:hypothetical protein